MGIAPGLHDRITTARGTLPNEVKGGQLLGSRPSKLDGFRRTTPLHGVDWRASLSRIGAVGLLCAAASACAPTVIIGEKVCPESIADGGPTPNPASTVSVPWSTSFEDGFCHYALPMGFCFGTGSGAYSLVTSPVHSGRYAAAFSVRSDADGGAQTRCVEQGVFPAAAYYGAWYYVPASAQNSGLWNLLHFQGGVPGQLLHGLWDVSLVDSSDGGGLHVSFLDFLTHATPDTSAVPPIPIGQWFHLEVYFKRARDTSGQFSLWQDGVLAVNLTSIATDDTDWGQWYVGNLATALLPPSSTVYVDDVTIGSAP